MADTPAEPGPAEPYEPPELTRREALIAGGSAALTGAVTWLVTAFVSRADTDAVSASSSSLQPAAGATVAVAPPASAVTPPAVAGAVRGLTVYEYEPVKIANLADLAPNAPLAFSYPTAQQSAVLVKLDAQAVGGVGPDADVVAFSDICTHMGCPLGSVYDATHRVLGPCPCHFTTFDLRQRGIVVLGQATDDLPQIVLRHDEASGDVFATGVMGLVYGGRSNLDALAEMAGAA